MNLKKDKKNSWAIRKNYKISSYIMLIACAALSTVISIALYNRTKDILEGRLKERLIAIVSTAALQFNVDDLNSITGPESVESLHYIQVVRQLQSIRNVNKNVRFAYLLRPTENNLIHHFIADADSINPSAEIDLNGDGVLNEEDALATPGDEYDISEIDALILDAKTRPTTDNEPVEDQWGVTLSAYAPIFSKGTAIAILGLDVDVTDYINLISATFIPFSFFIVFLIILLSVLTLFLVRVWQERVNIVEELDRQKDELLGIVAHQLGKPITAIRWNLESFLDGDLGALSAEQKKETHSMHEMAVNLADLTSMILDVSRIQLGKMNLAPLPLDLDALFAEILQVVKPTIEQKKLQFIKRMPEKLPTALLDKRYTRMTIENLLTNAVKYTPEGGTVTLDLALKDGVLHGKVADTGCGIPKGEQSKIFGKMFRASNVRNAEEGNGFGLYVAKGAIEGQGGKIWFESTEGKGTTFFFELPIKAAPAVGKA